MSKGAVFFDRDGIVNYKLEDDYVKNLDEFNIIPDFIHIFRTVKDMNFLAILVSNQQGIGKSLMSEKQLEEIHNFLQEYLNTKMGAKFDSIKYCTSLAEVNDYRRKPNPGMILEAIEEFDLDKKKCVIIGDSESDILAGKNAGISTILINNENHLQTTPDYHFKDLYNLAGELPLILYKLK
jgi:histidinol-phosphate phosphatase family protein